MPCVNLSGSTDTTLSYVVFSVNLTSSAMMKNRGACLGKAEKGGSSVLFCGVSGHNSTMKSTKSKRAKRE